MKKIISLILAVLMCVPFCTPVFADDGDEASSLILLAKERFGIDDEKFVFADYSKDSYRGKTVYYLYWEGRDTGEYSYQPSINLRIDSNGNVEYYRLSRLSGNELAIPAYSEEEAVAKATELVKIIAPDRAEKLANGEINSNSLYTVTFQRLENKIPVSGDYITVALDPQTLELTRYNASWSNAVFPVPEGIISKDDAREEYKKKIGYELLYNIVTENSEIKTVYLSYAPKSENAFIDAFTGEEKLYVGSIYYSGGGAMNDMAALESSKGDVYLSAEEKAMVEDIEKMITKNEAEELIRKMSEFGVPADAALSAYSVAKNRFGNYTVGITLSKESENEYYYARAEFDAATKELLLFWQSDDDYDEKDAEYGSEKAKDKAEALLKKYYGEKLSQTKPEFTVGESEPYEFAYDRYYNDIRVSGNGLTVEIGSRSGKITRLRCNWAETDFPDASNVIGLGKVYEKLLSDVNFNTVYLVTEIYDEKGTENTEVSLAYAPQNTPVYSSEKVVEIDGRGREIAEAFSGYSDINGHWCEDAANDLAKIGIYFEGGELKPESEATDEEFLKQLFRAVFNSAVSEREDIFRYAVSEGVIDEADVGKPLTRINAIRYIVNAMGFKEAAEIKGIYNCPFSDVENDMQGYAAIAGGLGIIGTSSPVLRPNDILTRAECVAIIHNYLSK